MLLSVCMLYSSNKSGQQSRVSDLRLFEGKSEEDGPQFPHGCLAGVPPGGTGGEPSGLLPPPPGAAGSGAAPCNLHCPN